MSRIAGLFHAFLSPRVQKPDPKVRLSLEMSQSVKDRLLEIRKRTGFQNDATTTDQDKWRRIDLDSRGVPASEGDITPQTALPKEA